MAIKSTRRESVFYLLNGLIPAIFFIVTLYPIVFLISASISSPEAAATGQVTLLPVGFSLQGYKMVFENKYILSGYANSFLYTVVGTVLNVTVTMLTAFVLSRKELIGRSFFSFMFAFTMWFNGGLIPSYLLLNNLGMLNTRWALWLPGIISVWNMIICKTYIASTIPEELFEAVSIDGCGYFTYFVRIVLPLSGAIVAVITLFYAIGHWNAYFNAMIYLNDKKLYPLQIILKDILIANQIDAEMIMDEHVSGTNYGLVELLKYALIMVACLPLWIAYPFVQKFFVKGVMVGSIKG